MLSITAGDGLAKIGFTVRPNDTAVRNRFTHFMAEELFRVKAANRFAAVRTERLVGLASCSRLDCGRSQLALPRTAIHHRPQLIRNTTRKRAGQILFWPRIFESPIFVSMCNRR